MNSPQSESIAGSVGGKTYIGTRIDGECEVYVKDQAGRQYPLSARWEIRNHSPSGFEWGYGGSGPAQLALAILADHFGPETPPGECPFCSGALCGWICPDNECGYVGPKEDMWTTVVGCYQAFKFSVVAGFHRVGFKLTSQDIEAWVSSRKEQRA